MRKWLAGSLIRLAHRIYKPRVVEMPPVWTRGPHQDWQPASTDPTARRN